VVQEIYEDHGISGKRGSRPGLDAMWADCRKGKVDVCLVWALDRLARSLKHLIEALDEFGRLGVDFVCLKQDIDTTNAASRLLFHINTPEVGQRKTQEGKTGISHRPVQTHRPNRQKAWPI